MMAPNILEIYMKFKSKICKECGKEFEPTCGTQLYCKGPHVTTCIYCGKEFTYSCSPKEKPKCCCRECIEAQKKKTLYDKYGVDNVSKLDSVKSKISTSLRSESTRQKYEKTCMQRYGVDNVSKSEEVKQKLRKIMTTSEYLENREKTCIRRYGTHSPSQCQSVKNKRAQTNMVRYGTPGHIVSAAEIAKKILDPEKAALYLQFKENPKEYIAENYNTTPTVSMLCKDLGVTDTPIYDILIQNNCNDLVAHTYSNMEEDVVDFIHNLCPEINIVRNDRKIISPMEIDIYIPEYKLGIECNPTSTHNSSFFDPWGGQPKHYKYHQIKSSKAKESGIFLFHIFGYEWTHKQKIIKSMIANLLHRNDNKVGARETYVSLLSQKECKEFLEANHRQGSMNASIRLGLKHKQTDELVSVMTFNKVRSTIGENKSCNSRTFELSRFCSKCGYSIAGGANKLFTYFLRNYKYSKIISFSDVAHTKGNLYRKLSFSPVNISSPNYVWVDMYDRKYYNRVNCQKKNLHNLFRDDNIDIKNKTEKEIMEEHGFAQVFDSGVIRWEYDNKITLQ